MSRAMQDDAATTTPDGGAALARECLARARALRPVLNDAAPRIEAARELPADVLQAMHQAQLFRLTLPRELSGAEIEPRLLAQVAEAIAMGDASAAWCLGQGSGCAMSAAFLGADAARQVFGPANAVLAWGAGAAGKAVATPGGYRISGRWPASPMTGTWWGCGGPAARATRWTTCSWTRP